MREVGTFARGVTKGRSATELSLGCTYSNQCDREGVPTVSQGTQPYTRCSPSSPCQEHPQMGWEGPHHSQAWQGEAGKPKVPKCSFSSRTTHQGALAFSSHPMAQPGSPEGHRAAAHMGRCPLSVLGLHLSPGQTNSTGVC